MGSNAPRSLLVAALCAGVAMVGASVHGLLAVDAELQRSALAAQRHAPDHTLTVVLRYRQSGDCPGRAPVPPVRHLS